MTVDRWIGVIAASGIGVFFVLWGVLLWRWQPRSGTERFARMYHHWLRLQGWPYRNAPSFAFPTAVLAIGFAILILLEGLGGDSGPLWSAVVIILLLNMLLVWWVIIRPPEWLKPPWLRIEEQRLREGLPSSIPLPPEGDRPVMTERAWQLQVAGLAAGAAAWLMLGMPVGPLLLGLGAAIPILLATRRKRTSARRGGGGRSIGYFQHERHLLRGLFTGAVTGEREGFFGAPFVCAGDRSTGQSAREAAFA